MDDANAEAVILCPKCSTAVDDHCANPACDWLRCVNQNCRHFGAFDAGWFPPISQRV